MMVETMLESSPDFGMSGALPQWKRELLQRRAARARPPPPAPPAPPPPPPPPPDDDEELRYGPGIVKRLKSRYLSLALRDAPRRRPSVLRRAASLEHLLEQRPPPAPRPAARAPRPASLAAPAPHPLPQPRRDSVKRARSVDALSRLEPRDEPPPPPPLPPRPSVRPPRRPAPLLRETERPPPDLVKSTLRKFEPARTRRAPPAARVSAALRGLEPPGPGADEAEGGAALRAVSRAALDGIARAGCSTRYAFEAPRRGSHLPPLAATNPVLVGRARRVGVIRPMPAPALERALSAPSPAAEELPDKPLEEEVRSPSPAVDAEVARRADKRSPPPPAALVEPIPRSPPADPPPPTPARVPTTDSAPLKPEPAPLKPDPALLKPDPTLLEPECIPLKPEPTSLEPEFVPLNPELMPLKPELMPLKPELVPVKPEPALLKPEPVPLKPEAGPKPKRLLNGCPESPRAEREAAARNGTPDAEPPWNALALKRGGEGGAAGGARRGGAAGGAGGVSVVFNFSHRKEVPDYIENDGLVLRPHRIKAGEPGVVVLVPGAGAGGEDSDEGDGGEGEGGPPSPCDVRFVNDNVLINGRSSMPARRDRDRVAKLKLQFDDSLTRTFEYPSETSLCDVDDDPPSPCPAPHASHTLLANTHIASAALSRYTPHKTRAAAFQPGVTRTHSPPPRALPAENGCSSSGEDECGAAPGAGGGDAPGGGGEAGAGAGGEGDARPCGADAARCWSDARALHTDLLF